MKTPLKLLLLAVGAISISITNTACTPGEAALVGAVAGAAIGYAVADDSYYHGGHGSHYGHGRGNYGYRGGYHGGYGGGYCY